MIVNLFLVTQCGCGRCCKPFGSTDIQLSSLWSKGFDVSGFLCTYNNTSETSEIFRVRNSEFKGVGVGFVYVFSRVGGNS
jgi:hypothetical protein